VLSLEKKETDRVDKKLISFTLRQTGLCENTSSLRFNLELRPGRQKEDVFVLVR
jgi:hypothetical protein